MNVIDAIQKAEDNEDVKKLRGYFLCSCFACIKSKDEKIKEWTLLYYNPEKNLVLDCFINDKFVTVGDETPPISEVEKPDFHNIDTTIEEVLDKVGKNFSEGLVNVLITLHKKASVIWTINFITADMNATTFDVDVKTGKILREESTSLIRKL